MNDKTSNGETGRLLPAAPRSASVLELDHAKSKDAHCLACGFRMLGGRDVGLCPKCGSNRWYRTRLTPDEIRVMSEAQ